MLYREARITLKRSFVFKDFLLWLSGENGSFEVINRIIIQYIIDVCRLWLMLVKNGVTGRSTGMNKYFVYNLSFIHVFIEQLWDTMLIQTLQILVHTVSHKTRVLT